MKQKDFDMHEGAAILTKNQGYMLEDYVSYAIIRMAFGKVYNKKIPFCLVRCPQTDRERLGIRIGCLTVEESYVVVDGCSASSVMNLWEKYGRICVENKDWDVHSASEKESAFLDVRDKIHDFFLGNSEIMEDIMSSFISTWDESNDCFKLEGIRGVINNNRSLLQQATNVIESMISRFCAQAINRASISTKFYDALNNAKENPLMKLSENEYIVIFKEPFHVKHIELTISSAFLNGRVGGNDIIRVFIQENKKKT